MKKVNLDPPPKKKKTRFLKTTFLKAGDIANLAVEALGAVLKPKG